MQAAVTVRSSGNRRMAMVIWAAAAVAAVLVTVDGGPAGLLRYGLFLVAVAELAWLVYWRPHVRLDADGVRVVNVLRTVTIPWPAITGVEARWGLRIDAAGRRHRAWAVAPATGAPSPGSGLLDLADGLDVDVTADAGQVARLIELHASDAGPPSVSVPTPAPSVAVGPVLVVAATLALALLVRALTA